MLEWIQDVLHSGTSNHYARKQVSEYVISDSQFIERLLRALQPYVVNKAKQLQLALQLLELRDRYKNLVVLQEAVLIAQEIRSLNGYPKKNSFSSPVTTDPHSGKDSVSSEISENL